MQHKEQIIKILQKVLSQRPNEPIEILDQVVDYTSNNNSFHFDKPFAHLEEPLKKPLFSGIQHTENIDWAQSLIKQVLV